MVILEIVCGLRLSSVASFLILYGEITFVNERHSTGIQISFNTDEIYMYLGTDSDDKNVVLHGEILLLTLTMIRLKQTIRKQANLYNELLRILQSGFKHFGDTFDDMEFSYKNFNSIDENSPIKYSGKLAESFAQRVELIVDFNNQNCANKLKTYGFGFLGKNIEPICMFSLLIFIREIIIKYKDDKEYLQAVQSTLIEVSSRLINSGKISLTQQSDYAKEIADNFAPIK